MDEKSKAYIDQKFDKVYNNMKWFVAILISILSLFATFIVANMKSNYENKQGIALMQIEVQSLQINYKELHDLMLWSIEIAETNRELTQAIVDDKDVSAILEKINTIEDRVYSGFKGLPSYRGDDKPMKQLK